jgi:hypothetical protein
MKKSRSIKAQVIGILWEEKSDLLSALKMMNAPFEGAFIKSYP